MLKNYPQTRAHTMLRASEQDMPMMLPPIIGFFPQANPNPAPAPVLPLIEQSPRFILVSDEDLPSDYESDKEIAPPSAYAPGKGR
jgi:hypothetical protein